MDLSHLQALVEVVRTGSVAAAAHNLYLSASAVSKQISSLERELKVKLFDKVGRHLVPRQEAQTVYRSALETFRGLEQLRDQLAADDGQIHGHVSLGCGAFFARAVLPPIIADCLRTNPQLRIAIFEYSRIEEVHKGLLQGEYRMMIGLNWLGDPGLVFEPLFDDELVLIVPRRHPLARSPQKPLTPEDLRGQTVIAHSYPRVLNSIFARGGIPPDIFAGERSVNIMMRNTETVSAFVEEGLGVAFVPRYHVRLLPERKVVVRRMNQRLPITCGVYRLAGTTFTAAEYAVVAMLRRHTLRRFPPPRPPKSAAAVADKA